MKVFIDDRAAIVSTSADRSAALQRRIESQQRLNEHVNGFGHGDVAGRYWMWILPRPDATADQLRGVLRQVSATIETMEGLVVEPDDYKQAQLLANRIGNLTSVKTAHALGTMIICVAVVPKPGANIEQLKRDIETLASKIR